MSLSYTWNVVKFRAALVRDGAYLLRSNQAGWSAQEFWETYIQLTIVERAFRVLKSELLLRPIWHHTSGRTQAHIFVCVLAYALWKTLDHLAKQAGLQTLCRKPDPEHPEDAPKPRPMTPEAILRELSKIQIGDIHLETTTGQNLVLRRVAHSQRRTKTHPGRLGCPDTRATESRPPFVVRTAEDDLQKTLGIGPLVQFLYTKGWQDRLATGELGPASTYVLRSLTLPARHVLPCFEQEPLVDTPRGARQNP